MVVTTDSLLAGVKRRGILATNTTRLDDDDLITFLNDAISSDVVPFVDSCNGNFFVTTTTTPIVAGQSKYDIPYRAIGRTLRELRLISSDGVFKQNLPEIRFEETHDTQYSGIRYGYFFIGDQIELTPPIDNNYQSNQLLEISWKMQPNKLVKLSQAAKVITVSDPNVVVETIGDLTNGASVDFIAGRSGNRIYDFDQTITNISGTTITFGADVIPSSLAPGDYISLAETSPVVNMIPDNCAPLLEMLATREALQALGDSEGANEIVRDIRQTQENLNKVLQPRNQGEPVTIINRNSLVRGRLRRGRYYYSGAVN